jgi:hypothetical protein
MRYVVMNHYILCSFLIISQSCNSSDSCQSVEGCTFDDTKKDKTVACSDVENDQSDSENIALSGSNSESSSPRNYVNKENEFLVPDYENQPDPGDICGLKWGKDCYIQLLKDLCKLELGVISIL